MPDSRQSRRRRNRMQLAGMSSILFLRYIVLCLFLQVD